MTSPAAPPRWMTPYVVFVSLWAITIGVLPSTALGALSPFIVEELAISRGVFGQLYAVFHLSGVLFGFLAGRFVDAFGARRSMFVMATCTIVGVTVIVTSNHALILALGCFLAGIAFAGANPGTNTLLAGHLPAGRIRNLALGIKQGGIPLAAVLAGAVITSGASRFGWRVSYGVLIVAGVLIFVALLLPLQQRPTASPVPQATATVVEHNRRALLILAVFGFGMGSGTSQMLAYFTLYLVESSQGFDPVTAGYIFSAVGAMGIVGRVVWSVSTNASRQWPNLILVSSGAAVTAIALVLEVALSPLMIVFLVLTTGIFVLGWSGAFQVALVLESGTRVGRGSGIAYTGFSLGLMMGPAVFGQVLDTFDSYRAAWLIVLTSFLIASVAAVYGRASANRHPSPARSVGSESGHAPPGRDVR